MKYAILSPLVLGSAAALLLASCGQGEVWEMPADGATITPSDCVEYNMAEDCDLISMAEEEPDAPIGGGTVVRPSSVAEVSSPVELSSGEVAPSSQGTPISSGTIVASSATLGSSGVIGLSSITSPFSSIAASSTTTPLSSTPGLSTTGPSSTTPLSSVTIPSSSAAAVACTAADWQLKSYTAGEKAKGTDGNCYTCKPHPYSGWCGQGTAYQPIAGFAWGDAWTRD